MVEIQDGILNDKKEQEIVNRRPESVYKNQIY